MREQQVDNALVQSICNNIQMDRAIRRRQSELIATIGPFVSTLSARSVHHLLVVIRSKPMAAQLILWIIEISMVTVRTQATPCSLRKVNIRHHHHQTDTLVTIMPITIRIHTSTRQAQTIHWPSLVITIRTHLACHHHNICRKTSKFQKTGKTNRKSNKQTINII